MLPPSIFFVLGVQDVSWVSFLTPAAILVSAGISVVVLIHHIRENALARAHEFFLQTYPERHLLAPLVINGYRVTVLGAATGRIEQLLESGEITEKQFKDLKDDDRREPGLDSYAYEVGIALQRVGAFALTGAIPLDYVLAHQAGRILKDYVRCAPSFMRNTPRGSFRRRHATWLACSCAIYLDVHWPDEYKSHTEQDVPLEGICGERTTIDEERRLRKDEYMYVPLRVHTLMERLNTRANGGSRLVGIRGSFRGAWVFVWRAASRLLAG
jgi:hypothetical protein